MGSNIKINDTLQITKEQGFPEELSYEKHVEKNFTAEDLEGQTFNFSDKPGVRVYQRPPVRNFLVENIDGKWLYWGQVHILDIQHDYQKETTSGTFKITKIFTPEMMKNAHQVVDFGDETNFFVD